VVRVKFVKGVRLLRSQKGFTLEYLLQTFEPEMNIWVRSDQVAEDVKSDYEAKWWQCCRTVCFSSKLTCMLRMRDVSSG